MKDQWNYNYKINSRNVSEDMVGVEPQEKKSILIEEEEGADQKNLQSKFLEN